MRELPSRAANGSITPTQYQMLAAVDRGTFIIKQIKGKGSVKYMDENRTYNGMVFKSCREQEYIETDKDNKIILTQLGSELLEFERVRALEGIHDYDIITDPTHRARAMRRIRRGSSTKKTENPIRLVEEDILKIINLQREGWTDYKIATEYGFAARLVKKIRDGEVHKRFTEIDGEPIPFDERNKMILKAVLEKVTESS